MLLAVRSKCLYLYFVKHDFAILIHVLAPSSPCLASLDFELTNLLPSLDSLLSYPLLVDAGLAQDTHFQFLVSAGYEHINRIQNTSTS